jgi:hypothetical protein
MTLGKARGRVVLLLGVSILLALERCFHAVMLRFCMVRSQEQSLIRPAP